MARKWYYTLTYSHAYEPHSTICGAQIEWHELKRRRKTQTHISKRLYRKSDVLNNNHKRYLTNVRLLPRVILPYSFCSSVYILCTWHRSYACNEAHCQDRNTAWHPILHQHTHAHTHIEPCDVSLHQLAGVIRLTLRESIASSILTYMIYHWYNKMHSLSWNTGACSANKLNSKKATCQTMWIRKFSSCRQRFWKRLLLISEDREKERTLKTLCHSFNGERNVKLANIGCLWLAYVVFRTFNVWGKSKSENIKKNNFSISPGILTLNICFCVTLFQLLLWIYTRRVCVGSN